MRRDREEQGEEEDDAWGSTGDGVDLARLGERDLVAELGREEEGAGRRDGVEDMMRCEPQEMSQVDECWELRKSRGEMSVWMTMGVGLLDFCFSEGHAVKVMTQTKHSRVTSPKTGNSTQRGISQAGATRVRRHMHWQPKQSARLYQSVFKMGQCCSTIPLSHSVPLVSTYNVQSPCWQCITHIKQSFVTTTMPPRSMFS